MNLSREYIVEVLGIDIPLNESLSLNRELQRKILNEHLLYESFLTSLKDYAKDKVNKVVDTIKDWKDAAAALFKVISDPQDLGNFVNSFWKSFKSSTLTKFYGFLDKIKLGNLKKTIQNLIDSITNLSGWKKFLAATAIGSIIYYIVVKLKDLPAKEIKNFIAKYVSGGVLKDVLGKLTNFKSYLGWLQPIIKGSEIFHQILSPTIDKFKSIFQSKFRLYKGDKDTVNENNKLNNKLNKMKKSEFKKLIKENILSILREEDEPSGESGLDTKINISSLVKKLGNVDVPKFNSAFKLLQQGKPLNNLQNKVMADTFIALMKNNDQTIQQQFRAAFKKIN